MLTENQDEEDSNNEEGYRIPLKDRKVIAESSEP